MRGAPDVDMVEIAFRVLRDHGFDPDFPPGIETEIPKAAPSDAIDLRSLPWSSIDNLESRDLEIRSGSATWIDRHAGHWWVSFANYAGAGGAPGRGPESTQLIRLTIAMLLSATLSVR
jgi:hypothetical protein